MTVYERLDQLFKQNNGILKTAQVLESGITKSAFCAYAKQRGVEQAAHGVYASPDAWMDALYLLHLRFRMRSSNTQPLQVGAGVKDQQIGVCEKEKRL